MSEDEFDPFSHNPDAEPPGTLLGEVSEEEWHERAERSALPSEPLPPAGAAEVQRAGLVSARSLLPADYDEDQGDFEPGGRYKGFEIVPPAEWPHVARHAHIERRFYVRYNDTMGLVPWPGSMIVWPWEAAWEQDLYREEVTSYLKEDEKKGAKKRG